MKKKLVPTLRLEVKVKVDIVTSDDIKIYYTGKIQDFTARYMINKDNTARNIQSNFFFFFCSRLQFQSPAKSVSGITANTNTRSRIHCPNFNDLEM